MSIELSRLEAVELRKVWTDEAQDFTPWLAKEENLSVLSETLGINLEFEAKEIRVGDFQADILCRDPENPENEMRVLIENQLEETDHKHLGQILTYAVGLNAYTIIWIARKFRDEHRAALDRLNEIAADKGIRFFGIEIKVYQIGNSDRAPQFEVVSSPNNWQREVSKDTQREIVKDLPERKKLNIIYWTELRDYMKDKNIQLQFPSPSPESFLIFSIGRAGFTMDPWLGRQKQEIGIRLYIKGDNAKEHFNLLKQQQNEIENAFDEPLEWHELPEKKSSRVSIHKSNTDPTNETDWNNQHEWLALKLELFDKVFRPRIKELIAEDWEPPENEYDE